VQAIKAERMSTTQGVNEVLVVLQPDWIPIANVPDGPVSRQHRAARKCIFMSSVGKVILPVQPKTTLQADMDATAARLNSVILEARQHELFGSGEAALCRVRGTPRKSLGSVAKRGAPSTLFGNLKT
jgi:hypothetical protein